MSMFRFRSRQSGRDKATDAGRFDRLSSQIESVVAQIVAERQGLESRFQSASVNGAFLLAAVENEERVADQETRARQLAHSLMQCQERLGSLSRQQEYVESLKRSLGAFLNDNSGAEQIDPQAPSPETKPTQSIQQHGSLRRPLGRAGVVAQTGFRQK